MIIEIGSFNEKCYIICIETEDTVLVFGLVSFCVFHLQLNAANVFMERVTTRGDKWASRTRTPLKRSIEKFFFICSQLCTKANVYNFDADNKFQIYYSSR